MKYISLVHVQSNDEAKIIPECQIYIPNSIHYVENSPCRIIALSIRFVLIQFVFLFLAKCIIIITNEFRKSNCLLLVLPPEICPSTN